MFYRFEFEAAFYPALERVPFHVRMKLDVAGIRLSLNTWRAFSLEERRALCHLPADTDEEREVFASFLAALAQARAGVEAERCPALDADAWAAAAVPEPVSLRSEGEGVGVTPARVGKLGGTRTLCPVQDRSVQRPRALPTRSPGAAAEAVLLMTPRRCCVSAWRPSTSLR